MRLLQHRVGQKAVFHNDQDTGRSLYINKSVDINPISPIRAFQEDDKRQALIVDFIQGRKGIGVIITDCYPGKEEGPHFVTIPRLFKYPDNDVNAHVHSWAERLGLTYEQFTGIIECVAPPLDRAKLIEDIRLCEEGDDMPMMLIIERLKAMDVDTTGLVV